MRIEELTERTLRGATEVWNEVVREGNAFPQEEELTDKTARAFFASQSYVGVATEGERVTGVYILHPNNVGRCGHICNASYAVGKAFRGKGVGKALVTDCMQQAKALGFSILQFNAVVATNAPALALYEKLGFVRLGTIPGGFRNANGVYEDIIPHFIKV